MYIPHKIFTILVFLIFPVLLISQTFIWSEEGAILRSRDLKTGEEKIIFETDFLNQNNSINHIALDQINKRVYFQLHIFEPQPQMDLLMVIDYSGENLKQIKEFFIPTSMVYNNIENSIYYTISSGTVDQVGIRKFDLLTGNDDLIYNSSSCFSLQIDENDSKLFFRDGFDKKGINLDGSGLYDLSFLPPDANILSVSNFSINPISNDFYLTNSPLLADTVLMLKVKEDGSKIDTILKESSFGDGVTYHIPEAPFVDQKNNKLFYFWVEDDFFTDDFKKVFRSSNLDGSNIQNIYSVFYSGTDDPIDAWTIDTGTENNNTKEIAIKHYHYMSEHPIFNKYSFLGSAITNPPEFQEFKLCTDGSKASIFEVNHLFDLPITQDEYYLRIKEDPDGENPEIYGAFSQVEPTSNEVLTFQFQHPEYIESGINGDYIHIEVIENSSGNTKLSIPLALFNTPVLLVHGAFTDNSIFDDLILKIKNNYEENFIHDLGELYTDDSENSFQSNLPYIPFKITEIIEDAVTENNISTGKIDLIGHGTGGILARLYTQQDIGSDEALNYKNDINRFISISTPHFGTQLGNFIGNNNSAIWEPFYCIILFLEDIDCTKEVLTDLAVDENFIDEVLNGSKFNQNKIPTHCIYGSDDIEATQPKLKKNKKAKYFFQVGIKKLLWLLKFVLGDWDTVKSSIYGNQENDEVSPISSQIGGLQDSHITEVQKVNYWEIMAATTTINMIENLLQTSAKNATYFSQSGLSFQDLDYNVGQFEVASANFGDVEIISPAYDEVIYTNTNLDLNVQPSNIETSHLTFTLKGETSYQYFYDGQDIKEPIFIDHDSIDTGQYKVQVIAFDTINNYYSFDTTRIEIKSDSILSIHQLDRGGNFNLFPNPTSANIILRNSKDRNISHIDIINSTGEKIESLKVNWTKTDEIKLDTRNYSNGLYWLIVNNKNDIISFPFVKMSN